MTTLTSPKGTLPDGKTARPTNAPDTGVTDGCPVATPPTVMLFAAIVVAAIPCASMYRGVSVAVPRKLNVVSPGRVL